jgi:hypothetical protein
MASSRQAIAGGTCEEDDLGTMVGEAQHERKEPHAIMRRIARNHAPTNHGT